MKQFIGLIIVFISMNLIMIALGAGIGLLLHWASSAVDLGTGILIGVVSIGITLHYIVRLLNFLGDSDLGRKEADDTAPRRKPVPTPFDPMPSWPNQRRKQP
ncbi:MAG: hypothetical protein JO116_18295 [Planctomycetaceae bacterium]|nr:hypothetical protein [Planctomycetaceae bacterium]